MFVSNTYQLIKIFAIIHNWSTLQDNNLSISQSTLQDKNDFCSFSYLRPNVALSNHDGLCDSNHNGQEHNASECDWIQFLMIVHQEYCFAREDQIFQLFLRHSDVIEGSK